MISIDKLNFKKVTAGNLETCKFISLMLFFKHGFSVEDHKTDSKSIVSLTDKSL